MKQVWIIDDDDEMTRAIGLMLKLLKVNIKSFNTARKAAKALLGGAVPDLFLLDINMPEVSGLDLLEFIRRRPDWQKIPILMLSSDATEVQMDHARQLGANDYLTKPVTMDELEQALNKFMK